MGEITITLTREEAIQMMGEMMGQINQDCQHVAWMDNAEDEIPQLAAEALHTGQDQPWGSWKITVREAQRLTELADKLGHWLDWQPEGYTPYTPKDLP